MQNIVRDYFGAQLALGTSTRNRCVLAFVAKNSDEEGNRNSAAVDIDTQLPADLPERAIMRAMDVIVSIIDNAHGVLSDKALEQVANLGNEIFIGVDNICLTDLGEEPGPAVRRVAYDRYVMWWLTDHGYTLTQLAEIVKQWQKSDKSRNSFESYLSNYTLDNGSFLHNYRSFLKAASNEAGYNNPEFMCALLGDCEFVQYMEDREQIVVIRKNDSHERRNYITFRSNSCGCPQNGDGCSIASKELPENLHWAYDNLLKPSLGKYPNLCCLMETPTGYGVGFILEYNQNNCKDATNKAIFEWACGDAANIALHHMQFPNIQVVVVEDNESERGAQSEVAVIFQVNESDCKNNPTRTANAFREMAYDIENFFWYGSFEE